jgi:hypothetical protein
MRFGVATALVAALAWAVSVIMLKAPLSQVDPVTAQPSACPWPASCSSRAWGWRTPASCGGGLPLAGRLVRERRHARGWCCSWPTGTRGDGDRGAVPDGAHVRPARGVVSATAAARSIVGTAITAAGIAVLHA